MPSEMIKSGTEIVEIVSEDEADWARRFFDLPLEEKLAIHMKKSKSAAGYSPLAGQALDSFPAASLFRLTTRYSIHRIGSTAPPPRSGRR